MMGLDTKFLLPEACPMHNLADKRLARGKVTTRFNPHRTYRLKTSLRDTLFHLRIEFRNVLFQPLKHLRLALTIVVVGIALHQSQHIRDGMSDLLAGSPVRPHPPDIEMGMSADSNPRAVSPTINRVTCPPDRVPTVAHRFIVWAIYLVTCPPGRVRHVLGKMRLQVIVSSLCRVIETFTLLALAQIEHVIGRIEMR